MDSSISSTRSTAPHTMVFVLDGYLQSKAWPELAGTWQSLWEACQLVERWNETSASPRCLAIEHWLCQQLGWEPCALSGLSCWPMQDSAGISSELLSASHDVLELNHAPELEIAAHQEILLTPCHFYVRLDHVGVSSLGDRPLGWDESISLRRSLSADLLEWSSWFDSEIDIKIRSPMHWVLKINKRPIDVEGCSLALAEGLNVEQYLARGEKARLWRRVLNQIQMIWYEHSVNVARADAGLQPVNALWLGGSLYPGSRTVKRRFNYHTQEDYMKGLERYTLSENNLQNEALLLMKLNATQLRPETIQHGIERVIEAIKSRRAEDSIEILLCSDHDWEHYRASHILQPAKPGLIHQLRRWLAR
ncbi:MAG: hypothetical protein ACO31S_11410 [Burkholderiaceae bacterium]